MCCLFVILVIPRFGFEGWLWVLIASVPECNALNSWKISIFNIIEKRILFYSKNLNLLPPKPKLSFRHLKQGIQQFHEKFVFAPADKASNNAIVV